MINILFLCSENADRSLMAEALLNFAGRGRFWAYSAGPAPAVGVDPLAVQALKGARIPSGGLFPKDWNDFRNPRAPRMDLVVSLCPYVPLSTIPAFPGDPDTAYWPVKVPKPSGSSLVDQQSAFARTLREIESRVIRLHDVSFADAPLQIPGNTPKNTPGAACVVQEKALPPRPPLRAA